MATIASLAYAAAILLVMALGDLLDRMLWRVT